MTGQMGQKRASGRFDYVKYSGTTALLQEGFKTHCQELEKAIELLLGPGRATSLALTKLEEVYMWIGKALRDLQIATGRDNELQEGRSDS